MADAQQTILDYLFPKEREKLNALFSCASLCEDLAALSEDEITARREEAIRRSKIYFNGWPLNEQSFCLIYGSPDIPPSETFRAILFQFKPYLASNEAYLAWWALEPADRWYALTSIQENNEVKP